MVISGSPREVPDVVYVFDPLVENVNHEGNVGAVKVSGLLDASVAVIAYV